MALIPELGSALILTIIVSICEIFHDKYYIEKFKIRFLKQLRKNLCSSEKLCTV